MADVQASGGAGVYSNGTMHRATKNEDHPAAADKIRLVDLVGVEPTTSTWHDGRNSRFDNLQMVQKLDQAARFGCCSWILGKPEVTRSAHKVEPAPFCVRYGSCGLR